MAEEPSLSELIEQLKCIRIQEARVIDQIDRVEHTRATRATTHAVGNVFQPGNRVRITNGVKAGQRPTGTVTKVSADRISITTDDGTKTWRASKNLTRWF
jgi:hypothetical protein